MIVLDDQISNRRRIAAIAQWYPGAVVSIRAQRPHGIILDSEVPTLLLPMRQPTFVTINYRDFNSVRFLHAAYCIICFRLEQRDADRVPGLLRAVLRLPLYRTKAQRLGKLILWTESSLTHLSH